MTAVVATPETNAGDVPPEVSERVRHENRLGQRLVAPAVVVMLIVTAFPILRALYLSFYNTTTPSPPPTSASSSGCPTT